MKPSKLHTHSKIAEGDWVHECDHGDPRSPERVCETFHPVIRVNLAEYNRVDLNEMTYKDLAKAIDPTFMGQGWRALVLDGNSIEVMGFDDDTMEFSINSSEFAENHMKYVCSIKFEEWDEVGQDQELTPMEKARLLLWTGNIRVHCTDPSFLYFGYQYILTQLGASIYPEERFPKIRNPGVQGIVCKHLNRILGVLGAYSGDIAQEMSRQFGGELDKDTYNKIARRKQAERSAKYSTMGGTTPDPNAPPAA